jgi:hypothetical protein
MWNVHNHILTGNEPFLGLVSSYFNKKRLPHNQLNRLIVQQPLFLPPVFVLVFVFFVLQIVFSAVLALVVSVVLISVLNRVLVPFVLQVSRILFVHALHLTTILLISSGLIQNTR